MSKYYVKANNWGEMWCKDFGLTEKKNTTKYCVRLHRSGELWSLLSRPLHWHRIFGPAVIYYNGKSYYYLDGIPVYDDENS